MKRFGILALAAVLMSMAGSCDCKKKTVISFPRVRASRPVIMTMEENRSFTGLVMSDSMIQVRPKTSGRLMNINVRINQKTKKGDLLFSMESDVARQELARARAGVSLAGAQLEKAKKGVRDKELDIARNSLEYAKKALATAQKNFKRVSNLYQSGVISRSMFEEVRDKMRSAETNVQNAQKKVDIMKEGARTEDIHMAEAGYKNAMAVMKLASLQLDYTRVQAPVDGTIADIMVDPGNVISPRVPVMLLVNTGNLKVVLSLPEVLLPRIRKGQAVRVEPQAFHTDKYASCTIRAVYPVVDPKSGTFKVEVPLSGDIFRPGMMVRAVIILSKADKARAVSWKAILRDEDGSPYFFILKPVNGNLVSIKTKAILGLSSETMTQVKELDPESMIVTDGAFLLKDGDKVELIDNAAS